MVFFVEELCHDSKNVKFVAGTAGDFTIEAIHSPNIVLRGQ